MKPPIKTLKKAEIIYLSAHKCKHGVDYLYHYNCFLKEKDVSINKICFLDIESGASLTADFGYILSYCISDIKGNLIINSITSSEVRNEKVRDKRLITDFCRDIAKFEKIVVYYGKDRYPRHDMPFLRTRALYWNIKTFPKWKEKKVQDMYDVVKHKMKLYRSGQANACRFLNIEKASHPINPVVWQSALSGDSKALKYIVTHNIEDVKCLRKLWIRLVEYSEASSTI